MLIFFTILSCTEKPIIIPPFEPITSDRIVLVEEVTGVRCPNCPSGSAKIANLLEQFPGQVVAVGIHGDFLTFPYNESKFDFRNDFAKEIENYLKPWEGKPAAFVNRKKFDEEPLVAISEFDLLNSYVSQELNASHLVSLDLSSQYDEVSRSLELFLGVIPLQDLEGDFKVSIMLTESHIIDRQANVGEVIEEYEHNHVLRTMLTAFDGDPIASSFVQNEIVNQQFQITLPPEDGTWIADNMYAVAFISDLSGDQKVVLQAIEIPIR